MVPKSACNAKVAEVVKVMVKGMAAPEPAEMAGGSDSPVVHSIMRRNVPEILSPTFNDRQH
jgi:hypothetical protein